MNTPYIGQFDSKPYEFKVLTREKAECVAAWLVQHGTSWAETDYDAPRVRRMGWNGKLRDFDEFQHKLETVYRAEFLAAFPGLDVDYSSGTKWACDVNTVMSNWEAWAHSAQLVADIKCADIPEPFRVYLLERVMRGEHVDSNSAKERFPLRDVQFDCRGYSRDAKSAPVPACHFAYYQEAYGDRNVYAVFRSDGNFEIKETYYSIGD